MSRRLQVILDDSEYRVLQKSAAQKHLSIAEYVRQILRAGTREQSTENPSRKLAAVRRSTLLCFPAPDIDDMLAEIERGYEINS